jgi:hypothetical protein
LQALRSATGGLADGAIAGVGGGLLLRGLFAAGTGDLTFQGTQLGAHQLDPSLGEPDFSVPEFGLALALGAIAPLVAQGISRLFGPNVVPEIVPATAEPLTFPDRFETLSQIQINARNGAEFPARVCRYGTETLEEFREEVSIRPFTNADGDIADFRIRLDGLGVDPDTVNFAGLEAKGSEMAPLTPNQTEGIPLLEQFGGRVVGNGGNPSFPAGTVPTPTPVQIIRPSNLPGGY